jgi:hypothetical protein
MQKHQLEIDLTVLKELVGKYWASDSKDKRFRTYEDKNGKSHTIFTTDLLITEPKYKTKGDGSKIESDRAVLHDTGFAQVSEKNGDDWENFNFARLSRWIDKADTTNQISKNVDKADGTDIQYPEDEINPEDIPF